jgi:putative ABC transport system permease protein
MPTGCRYDVDTVSRPSLAPARVDRGATGCPISTREKSARMFLALRDLRRSWRRFVLVGSVVMLVAVLSTVLTGLADGLVRDGTSGLRALPFSHMAFEHNSKAVFSRSTLDATALNAWHQVPRARVSPLGASFVNAQSTKGGVSIDLALFGVPADSFLVKRGVVGRALEGHPGLVLASEVRDEGVKVGDEYTVAGSGVTLPVLGFTFAGSYGHVPIAYTPLTTWQSITYGNDARGRFSAIALDLPEGANVAAANRAANTELKTKTQTYDGSPGYTAETMTMTLIRVFLLVISALIVGAFFTVLTVQRTRQIGLLKAMGASSGYVMRDGLGQIAIIVLAAAAAGAAVGVGFVAILEGGAAPVELLPRNVLVSAALVVVTGIVGSLVAFRRITKIEPAIALGVEP